MKRRREEEKSLDLGVKSGYKNDKVPQTIRAVMGADANIYSLFDFVKEYAPDLPVSEPLEDTLDNIRLRNTLACPIYPLKPSCSRKVQCTQSLSSLVDDVVWSLVQRRSSEKTRNVLSHGYVSASEQLSQTHDIRPCREMRPGVVCTQINDNVSFCKTSSYAKILHRLVGDEVMRTLLLRTSMFLPVEQDWNHPKQNFLLLCGPVLKATRMKSLPGRHKKLAGEAAVEASTSSTNQVRQGRCKRRRKNSTSTPSQTQSTSGKDSTLGPNAVIPRASLFYSSAFVPKVGLPSTHILNQQPEKHQQLLLALLGTSDNKGRKRWKRVREMGVPLCQEIFRRHSKCDYHRLLNRYCPLPEFCQRESEQDFLPVTLPQVSAAYSPSDGVVSFLRAVLRHVFPPEFWGSEHNFAKVLEVTETFVNLRRQEQLPMKAVMNGIRGKDVLWTYGGTDVVSNTNADKAAKSKGSWQKSLHEAVTIRMSNAMRWIFVQYIIPLLRSVFYVTESEFSAKRVLYYRKPVWSMFRSLSMKKLLKRQYKEINSSEAAMLVSQQKMGFSKLRLLPKSTGVRALAMLSKREYTDIEKDNAASTSDDDSQGRDDDDEPTSKRPRLCNTRPSSREAKFGSTNAILRNVFEILRHERERHPGLFGSGVFGLSEVYPEYRRFLEAFRASNTSSDGSECKQLYFASVDIKQCYDSIEQKHLLDLLPKILDEEEYLIQNSAVIHPFESMARVLRKSVKRIGAPEAYCSFRDAAEQLSQVYNRSVFMENGGSSLVRRDNIMELLREHLLQHVVVIRGRHGNRFLLQSTGIPQGSILSTLLCNYYYGNVEKSLLGDVLEKKKDADVTCLSVDDDSHATLLVRIVDDFLLITTKKDLSEEFLTVMNDGSDDLGVHINKEKTLVNYSMQLKNDDDVEEMLPCPVADSEANGRARFPWCGMLFDTETGEVSVDYSRFANGKVTDSLTVDRSGAEGRQLEIRMKSFVRPRCQPMLFDCRINNEETAGVNFCQAILLCAVKTIGYIRGMEGGLQQNTDFIVRNIDDVISYTHKLIVDRLRHENKGSVASVPQECLLALTNRDAMWLGRKAFLYIFSRVRECNDVVTSLAQRCSSPGRHPRQDVVNEALRQFRVQVGD